MFLVGIDRKIDWAPNTNHNILPIPVLLKLQEILPRMTERQKLDVYNGILGDFIGEISVVNQILILLTCSNIVTKSIYPDEKLQKARRKRGKLPLFSYHTLVIMPTGKRQESIPKHLLENRIHLARGHFKTYNEDNPLFGKLTGRYWWQPHVRGRNKNGIVMKDYDASKLSQQ